MKSRRPTLIITFAAVVALFLATAGARADGIKFRGSFKGPLGLQLYSLRDQFAKDVPGTVELVNSFGIKYVELAGTYNLKPEEFKAQLLARGITPISAHFGYDLFRDHPEEAARQAEALGLKFVGCAWVPHQGHFTEQACRETAAVFNHAGEILAKHGIRFFYHAHGYEFEPFGDGTLFDLLIKETKPEFVSYEMDIFWVAFAGQSPAKLLEKYPRRWKLMHLKDMNKGLATGSLAGGVDNKNDVAIGTGQLDIPGILKAGRKAGIKYYFIEDESPSSVGQIPQSIRYLSWIKF